MTPQNKLRERKIYNDYEIARLGDLILVSYHKNGGRSCLPAWWGVYHTEAQFKNTAWYTDGAKIFTANNKKDIKALMKALTFASKVTKQYEWIKTPFGSYVSKFTADKVGFKYKESNIIKITEK